MTPETTSDPAAAPLPTDPDAEQNPAPHNSDDSDHDHPALRKARREAKGLRDRLNTAEAALDDARRSVDNLTRARAQEIAADMGLVDGSDLWRHGVNLSDLYDVDDNDQPTGGLDPQRVKDAVEKITADRPHLRRPAWRHRGEHLTYAQRMSFGVEPAPDAPEQEWHDYQAARARRGRLGAAPADYAGPPAATWSDALKRRQ